MKFHVAKLLVWNGRSFLMVDIQMTQTQESLGSVIREYVASMGVQLVYWCKV
ncbi:hypothetical protein [Acaryochloris marina]|uniref:Uncharacterized protein n=1 Tax=Acaryochloris marina (strain MBIC 11017) TaxID=329726 RepID=A8ZMA7_ACAM1|nr:hypothetical protein [Acaryochloris marina]ABW32318.1 hypothetical protein AM1_C0008 [Acaryochloris marina MBIC11017]